MRRLGDPVVEAGTFWFPAFVAGPIFILLSALFTLPASPTWPDMLPLAEPLPLFPFRIFVFMLLAAGFGMIPALVLLVPGIHLMIALARLSAGMQLFPAWGLAGGTVAAGVLAAFGLRDFANPIALAFVATGILCALLARRYVRWFPETEK